jgi:hypothetical protein
MKQQYQFIESLAFTKKKPHTLSPITQALAYRFLPMRKEGGGGLAQCQSAKYSPGMLARSDAVVGLLSLLVVIKQ